jgi:predicted RNA-binding protein with RPS1 domain
VGSETEGKITKLMDKGALVKLEEDIDGFVPIEHLGKPEITKPQEAFTEGEILPLRVIEFDRPQRKIILSVTAYFKGREKAELEAFLAKHPTKTIKVEELVEGKPRLERDEEGEKKEEETKEKETEKEPEKEESTTEDESISPATDKEQEDKSPQE